MSSKFHIYANIVVKKILYNEEMEHHLKGTHLTYTTTNIMNINCDQCSHNITSLFNMKPYMNVKNSNMVTKQPIIFNKLPLFMPVLLMGAGFHIIFILTSEHSPDQY